MRNKIFSRTDKKCADIVKQLKDQGYTYLQIVNKLNAEGYVLQSGKPMTKTDPNKALIDFYPEYRQHSTTITRNRTASSRPKNNPNNYLVQILSSDLDKQTKKYLLNKLL